jgi:uncharacterized membrane protein
MSLQEMIGLYLALPGSSKRSESRDRFFFFLLSVLSLLYGAAALFGVILNLVFIASFSLATFLASLFIPSLALNVLTFLLLLKQYSLPLVSDCTSQQILTALACLIGLIACPLLLPFMALLQVRKGS